MPSRKKVAASTATRQVRWVEGFKSNKDNPQPIFWNQLKTATVGEREVPVPTDRNSNFAYPAKGRAKPTPKYTDEVKKSLQSAVDRVIAQIQKIADGDVTSFFYSAESNTLRYSQVIDVDGTKITENKETDDETLLEAAQDFADQVADEVASDGKPLTVSEGADVRPAIEDED